MCEICFDLEHWGEGVGDNSESPGDVQVTVERENVAPSSMRGSDLMYCPGLIQRAVF